MFKAALSSITLCLFLFGCASSDINRIDHQIQKAKFKKIDRQADILQFIANLKSGDSFEHVKDLLETQQFEFAEKLETRTRIDGKAEAKVKKIDFWQASYPEDKFTLLFHCMDPQQGILKAAYHGVTEIQLAN